MKSSNSSASPSTVAASVVINAAGRGSRLGQNLPKSLVQVCGRSILEWQLTELCAKVRDVYLVVGFQGEAVVELGRTIRPNIQVVWNDRWSTTKTAGSLSLGAAKIDGRCLSLDGDLLVAPPDFDRLLHSPVDVIGVCRPSSSQPVYAQLDGAMRCVGFSYSQVTTWEWSGLVNFDPRQVPACDGNVFEMMDCILPAATVDVHCAEIDTLKDLHQAENSWPQIRTGRRAA